LSIVQSTFLCQGNSTTKCSATAVRFPGVHLKDFLAGHLRGVLMSLCFPFRMITGYKHPRAIGDIDRAVQW
jgi:hypothetical protein